MCFTAFCSLLLSRLSQSRPRACRSSLTRLLPLERPSPAVALLHHVARTASHWKNSTAPTEPETCPRVPPPAPALPLRPLGCSNPSSFTEDCRITTCVRHTVRLSGSNSSRVPSRLHDHNPLRAHLGTIDPSAIAISEHAPKSTGAAPRPSAGLKHQACNSQPALNVIRKLSTTLSQV